MKQAVVRVSMEELRQALLLPAGVGIDFFFRSDQFPTDLSLLVSGDALPNDCRCDFGSVTKTLVPQFYRRADGHVDFEGWEPKL